MQYSVMEHLRRSSLPGVHRKKADPTSTGYTPLKLSLEDTRSVEAVCEQLRDYYKAQLEANPLAIPAWKLVSSIRRCIANPAQVLGRLV
jgi:hypothetical protein